MERRNNHKIIDCSWCKSPKTWCRFFCTLTSLAHGCLYAALACLWLFDSKLSKTFPLASVIESEDSNEATAGLMAVNFILIMPYLAVAAFGTKNRCLLLFVFFVNTIELFAWLGVILYAVTASNHDSRVVLAQWGLLTAMVSLLFMCWTLLLMAWKKRRQEEAIALHSATLVNADNENWWPKPPSNHLVEITV